jgi:hypothetical protein
MEAAEIRCQSCEKAPADLTLMVMSLAHPLKGESRPVCSSCLSQDLDQVSEAGELTPQFLEDFLLANLDQRLPAMVSYMDYRNGSYTVSGFCEGQKLHVLDHQSRTRYVVDISDDHLVPMALRGR